MTSLLQSIPNVLERKADLLKRFFSRISLDRLVLVLVSLGSLLCWVKFPVSGGALSSGGVSSFNLYSPNLLFWGLLFVPTAILALIGIGRRFFLFLLLIIVLSFPLEIHWDYAFLQNVISETSQKGNIIGFAESYVYEPNVVMSPTDIQSSDITDLWTAPWLRVFLTIESLGVGFWIAFIGTIIVSRKLWRKKLIFALLFSIILSLPCIITAFFLTLGRNAFLMGNYARSVDMYRLAGEINQSFGFGNNTLKELEIYHLWLGESLFHMGVQDAPEVYLFLGNNLEGVDSFIKSKEMYRKAMSLPPAKKALARTIVKEAVADFANKEFGSAMERLGEAFELDKNQFEALFYMVHISFVLKDQRLALYYSDLLFDRCKERLLLSDVYNILGDMYYKADRLADSRTMYRKSIKTFDRLKDGNYHAWVGIAGW